MKASDVWVLLCSLVLASAASGFVPAACEEDPSRTLFAGFGHNPCKKFHGAEAACESAYYVNRGGEAVSCGFVAGTCVGCGGHNGACPANSCNGITHVTLGQACAGDPGRTALLGLGDNGSERCRNLDNTDQATCENAYYESEDDDVFGVSVACFWDTTSGACVGCGENGSACPFNPCDPTIEAPDAECTLDPERTLLGYGANGSNRCRRLQDTDEATCNSAYYEDRDTNLPVACWWDGDECRGSAAYFAGNACLTNLPSPMATATCEQQPSRSNLLGFGNNRTRACHELDGTDQATCEDAYYQATATGVSVACWWDGSSCRGSHRGFSAQNACENGVSANATCSDRTNLLGFGSNHTQPCRTLTPTDQTQCENAFYEHDATHAAVACWWDGDECRGSADSFRTHNDCFLSAVTCSLDPTRTERIGFGSRGQQPCRLLDGTGEAICEAAFYVSQRGTQAPVACWWDGGQDECKGSIKHLQFNSCVFEVSPLTADATCGQRANLLGVGDNGTAPCRTLDGSDEATCEDAYYENEATGLPIACWWDGSLCLGSSTGHSENNDCPVDEGECTLDPGRSNRLGFGDTGLGQSGGACRQLDDSDQATCEDAFYINLQNGSPVACWWDESEDDCRGSSGNFGVRNACMRAAPAQSDACPGRGTSIGFGNNKSHACRRLDGTSESTCEDAFYFEIDGLRPIACIWDDGDCLGTTAWPTLNECDVGVEPPACSARTLLGKGGNINNHAPCRRFDNTSEVVCEAAYYVSRDNAPVACWWSAGENACRGSNKEFLSENTCVPPVTCDGRSNRLGFGENGAEACNSLSGTDETICENAFYVTVEGSRAVACDWDGDDCEGCNRRNGGCPVNACDPIECTGDDGRNRVGRCSSLGDETTCENAWHVIGDGDVPPFAASCYWDAEQQACLGCGPHSQATRGCANECEDACGNGVLDGGETCDDGNMFPGDCCDSNCQLEPDGATCTDRLFCTTGAGLCENGECVGAAPRICASCFGDDCNEARNECIARGEGNSGDAQLQGIGPPPPSDISFPLPPGTECDDGVPGTDSACNDNGMCIGELVMPTPTPTRVPVGGPCADTSQCVDGAACVGGFCSAVAAPAPAASNHSLLAILAALLAIGAFSMRTRRQD